MGSPAPSPPAASETTTPRRLCGYLAPFFFSHLVTPANNSWRKHLRAFFIHKLTPGCRGLYHNLFLFIKKCSHSSALFRLEYPEVSGLLFPRPSVERLLWRQQDARSLKNKAGQTARRISIGGEAIPVHMRIELASRATLVSRSPGVRKLRSPGQCCRSRAGLRGKAKSAHARLPGPRPGGKKCGLRSTPGGECDPWFSRPGF